MLRVQKLDGRANVPTKGSELAAGYDLYSSEDTVIKSGGYGMVKTDLAIAVPEGTYGRVAPRSGLAAKKGIQVGAGVVDADYRGEIKVILFNHGTEDFEIKVSDRIAQLVLERYESVPIQLVDRLDDTERGEGGFGSTGK